MNTPPNSSRPVPIKRALQQWHQGVQLSASELEQLHALSDRGGVVTEKKNSSWLLPSLIVSNLLVCCMVGWFYFASPTFEQRGIDYFVDDLVAHHLSHDDDLYKTDSAEDVEKNLSFLNFILPPSQIIGNKQADFIGAKPCMILNTPAAEVRYRLGENKQMIIYQAKYQPAQYGEIPRLNQDKLPLVKVKDGVKVSLWRNERLLFAKLETEGHP